MSPRALIALALVALVVLAGAVIGGVAAGWWMRAPATDSTSAAPAPAEVAPSTAPRSSAALTPSSTAALPDAATLRAEFADLQDRLPASIGLAVHAVGGPPDAQALLLGDQTTGPAWSTIKVPLAIAGLSESQSGTVTDDVVSAITASDNDAAERIWAGLGDPVTAAGKVQEVLREYGDATTVVQSQKVRPEFSAFGQTQWSLTDQSAFLAAAACADRTEPVRALMGQISPDQRWGLGRLAGTQFKGGWGPTPSGNYLVRQYGIVDTPTGRTVVAIAATPQSGSFSDGTAALTEITTWLSDRLGALPAGTCG